MERFRKNYDFSKHVAIVAVLYALLAVAGNLILFKRQYDQARKKQAKENSGWIGQLGKRETLKAVACGYVKRPSKVAKAFNLLVGLCLIGDLCMYPFTKKWMSK